MKDLLKKQTHKKYKSHKFYNSYLENKINNLPAWVDFATITGYMLMKIEQETNREIFYNKVDA